MKEKDWLILKNLLFFSLRWYGFEDTGPCDWNITTLILNNVHIKCHTQFFAAVQISVTCFQVLQEIIQQTKSWDTRFVCIMCDCTRMLNKVTMRTQKLESVQITTTQLDVCELLFGKLKKACRRTAQTLQNGRCWKDLYCK